MIKFGIHHQAQLTPGHLEGFWGKRKFVALDLYQEIDLEGSLQEKILSRFPVSNGVYKFTFANRFNEFDSQAMQVIEQHFAALPVKVTVHDFGISDGRTTVPFFNLLNRLFGKRLEFSASDYAAYFYVVSRTGKRWRLVFDQHKKLLQIVSPPFVFNLSNKESKMLYPLNHIVRYILQNVLLKVEIEGYVSGNLRGARLDELVLLEPECKSLVDAKKIKFAQVDILDKPSQQYSIVRVMNLLNPGYFDEAALTQAIQNACDSIQDGGLLITGTNKVAATTVHGGVFFKKSGRMNKIMNSGEGSPVESLILAYRAAPLANVPLDISGE